jgi:hypothetical protein
MYLKQRCPFGFEFVGSCPKYGSRVVALLAKLIIIDCVIGLAGIGIEKQRYRTLIENPH